MEPNKDIYQQTREVYEELGKDYLTGMGKATPSELGDFIKLFPKGSKILDVGTAGGRDAKILVDSGMEVVGIDVVDVFLERARKDVPEAIFKNMDVRSLTFPEEFFDGICAIAVLLHLRKNDILLVLKRFHQILKPGGKLFIYLREGVGEKQLAEKLTKGKERFFSYYQKEEIRDLLVAAGFKIIHSQLMPDKLEREGIRWISVWGEK